MSTQNLSVPKVRESIIELLRIISMLIIVFLHVFDSQIGDTQEHETGLYLIQISISSFCIIGVNVFIFISGYFGIKFNLNTLIKLVLQVLFYSWIELVIYLTTHSYITNSSIMKYIFPIMGGTCWFLTVYIVLLFIAPYLNKGIECLNRIYNQMLMLGLLLFGIVAFIFKLGSISGSGYSIFHFITIYCMARYLKIYNVTLKTRMSILLYIGSMLLIIIYMFIRYQLHHFTAYDVWAYNNPLVILGAVCFFYIFKNMNLKSNFINRIAVLVFAVYLIYQHQAI